LFRFLGGGFGKGGGGGGGGGSSGIMHKLRVIEADLNATS